MSVRRVYFICAPRREDAKGKRRCKEVGHITPKKIFAPLRLCARPISVARQDAESAEGQVEIA